MDIAEIPFNRLVGLHLEPEGSDFTVNLPADPRYHNHLGIVHAAAQLTWAEAASGDWMLRHFGRHADRFIPVVRRIEAKFRRPAKGKILARATLAGEARLRIEAELAVKRMVSIELAVEVHDESGAQVLTAVVEWCMTRRPAAS